MAGEERVIINDQDSPSNIYTSRNRCCFHFPCFGPGPKPHLTLGGPSSSSTSSSPTTASFWDRADTENKWWTRPIRAFKKIREWSEIVAGPKWKTFIRRFNRNNRQRHGNQVSTGKFQYDPLSYALNFDEGQNGPFVDEDYGGDHFPDFSSRFAVLPMSAKTSMDLGRGAPAS